MRSWIAVAALFALGGCAEDQRSHAYVQMSTSLAEKTEYAHYQAQLDSADIALLDGKINFTEFYWRENPACANIRAEGYPTPAESAALKRWAVLRAAYFERFYALELKNGAASDKVAPLTQRYVESLREDLKGSTALISSLADGKMTYCEFATRQKASIIASTERAGPLHKKMTLAMAEEHYFDGTGLAGGIENGPSFYMLGLNNGNGNPGGHARVK